MGSAAGARGALVRGVDRPQSPAGCDARNFGTVTSILFTAVWALVGAGGGWVVRWGSVRLGRLEEVEAGNKVWQVYGPPILSALLFGAFAYQAGVVHLPLLFLRSVFVLVLVQVIFFDFEHRLILDRVMFPSMVLALAASLFAQTRLDPLMPWWAGIATGLGVGLLFILLAVGGSWLF